MTLRNPRESIPGGLYFVTEDGRTISGSTLRELERKVVDYLSGNDKDVPDDLRQIIEDQICERIGPKYCWKGFGDFVAGAIQATAGVVDAALGTNLKTQAKSCGSCGKRKRKLNRLTS